MPLAYGDCEMKITRAFAHTQDKVRTKHPHAKSAVGLPDMTIDGTKANGSEEPKSNKTKGSFVREKSHFRNWITQDGSAGITGSGGFKGEANRYHLYVSMGCPWACRTLMARGLKKLTRLISVSIVDPVLGENGWRFGDCPGSSGDHINGVSLLREIYEMADTKFGGRVTVPVLWDKQNSTIVNNESADIVRMFNSAFDLIAGQSIIAGESIDLYPPELRGQIDELNEQIYLDLNNGVYRAGFAASQPAYEEAFDAVFSMLDKLERRLESNSPFLFGARLVETDLRLFATLVRFDIAYYGLFKCNKKQIADFPALSAYLKHMAQLPDVWPTVNLDHIKTGYYSIGSLNPKLIIPRGPELDFIPKVSNSERLLS